MSSFKIFEENCQQVNSLINEFNTTFPKVGVQGPKSQFLDQGKPWSAKKKEILNMWRNLRPNLPILITPIRQTDMDKDTYGEDSIRITGSWNFIASILSRLKDVLSYENPSTRLSLILRGINSDRDARPDRNSFVFYLSLQERGKKRAGRHSQKDKPFES